VRDKKATGDEDLPGDVLKLLAEDGLRIMTQLTNNIHETEEWPKDFTQLTKKDPKATKCSNHHTISLITHTAKIVVRILRRRIERKYLKKISSDLEEKKELGMLKIISE
jgi:hypothetical protein